MLGGHGSPFDSVITCDEVLQTIDVRWPLWLAFVDYRGNDLLVDSIEGQPDALVAQVASSWDGFPKLYSEPGDDRPIVPRPIESIDALRAFLRDDPKVEHVIFYRDDRLAEVTAPRSLLLDTSRDVLRTSDDPELTGLARHLFRVKR